MPVIMKWCPDCRRWHGEAKPWQGRDRVGDTVLTIACEDCHAKRQAKVTALEAMYPSMEHLGLTDKGKDRYEVPSSRNPSNRPHSSGRRIFHKGEQMGG